MIDQLHKHDLALNPEHDLLLLFAGVGYGHTAGDKCMLGDDLNGSTLLRFDVLGDLDAACGAVSPPAPPLRHSKRRHTGRAPSNCLSDFPISDHPALAITSRAP